MAYVTNPGCTGFVLAGGHSSRMGSDKALVLFARKPLIQIALENLREAGLHAKIAGYRSDLSSFAETVPDTYLESGPLGGVHAGLSSLSNSTNLTDLANSDTQWSVFLPVDLPLMPASLLACLLQRAQLTGAPITVARSNGRIQPFPVVLHCEVLPKIEQLLDAGSSACHAAWQTIPAMLGATLDTVSVESLHQCGQCRHPEAIPHAIWFQSANSPTEIAYLQRYLRSPFQRFDAFK